MVVCWTCYLAYPTMEKCFLATPGHVDPGKYRPPPYICQTRRVYVILFSVSTFFSFSNKTSIWNMTPCYATKLEPFWSISQAWSLFVKNHLLTQNSMTQLMTNFTTSFWQRIKGSLTARHPLSAQKCQNREWLSCARDPERLLMSPEEPLGKESRYR